MRWSVVVPVKRPAAAKSRLYDTAGAVALPPRGELALAFAVDTVAAALRCPAVGEVLVVTADAAAAARLRAAGARTVAEPPDADLNSSLTAGAADAAARVQRRGVAALVSDLPGLRPDELGQALAAAARWPRVFVPDADGLGTTLLAACPGFDLAPRFGSGSRAAHRASGAVELAGDWPTLRHDVDTAADLRAAAQSGVGAATRAVVGELVARC